MYPCRQGRVGKATEKVTSSVDIEGELGRIPEGDGGNFEQDPKGGTTSVSRKGDPSKSLYLTFDLYRMSKINWRPEGGQVSESSRSPRGEPISDISKNPNG